MKKKEKASSYLGEAVGGESGRFPVRLLGGNEWGGGGNELY